MISEFRDKSKKLAQSNGTTFSQPDWGNIRKRLERSSQKRSLLEKKYETKLERNLTVLSKRELTTTRNMIANLVLLSNAMSTYDTDSDSNREKVQRAIRVSYLSKPVTEPFSEIPLYSSTYITQYISQMIQEEEEKQRHNRMMRKVVIKTLTFAVLVGVPAIVSGALILNPETVKSLLGDFIPEVWMNNIEENKTNVMYYTVMYIAPLVLQGPSQFILSTLTTNHSVRVLLTSSLSGGSGFVGAIFSNVAYSSVQQMAASGRQYLISLHSDKDFRYDVLHKAYLENLAADQRIEKVYKILASGKSLGEIEKELQIQERTSLISRVGYFLKKAASYTGSVAWKYKSYALALCFSAGVVYYMDAQITKIMEASLPMLLSLLSTLISGMTVIVQYFTNTISFEDVIKWVKSVYPDSVIAAKVASFTSFTLFPWIMSRLLNALMIPQYFESLLSRFPLLGTKIKDIRIIRTIKDLLGKFYGKEIEWDVKISTVMTHLFINSTISSTSLWIQQVFPQKELAAIMEVFDESTAPMFITGAQKAMEKFSESVEGTETSYFDGLRRVWGGLSVKELFPQISTQFFWLIPGAKIFRTNGEEAFEVIGVNSFQVSLRTAKESVTVIDLVSSSSFFTNYRVKNPKGDLITLDPSVLVQSSMANILEKSLAATKEGGELDRKDFEKTLNQSEKMTENPLKKLIDAGVDVEGASKAIAEKLEKSSKLLSIDPKIQEKFNDLKKINHRIAYALDTSQKLLEIKDYDSILLETFSSTKDYASIQEKAILAAEHVKSLKRDLDSNEELMKIYSDYTQSSRESLETLRKEIHDSVLSWLKKSLEHVEKSPAIGAGIGARIPPLDLSKVDSKIVSAKERIDSSTSSLSERVSKARESRVSQNNKGHARSQEKLSEKLNKKIESVQKHSREQAQRVVEKTNQILARVGVSNAVNFIMGNVNAFEITSILSLAHIFADVSSVNYQDIPDGISLDSLESTLDDLEKRKASVENLLSDAVGKEAATRCIETDKYDWDLKEGRAFNKETQKYDDTLNACFASAGVVSTLNSVKSGVSNVSKLTGVSSPFGVVLGGLTSLIIPTMNIAPLLYGRIREEVVKGEDSTSEAIHLFADLLCASEGSSGSARCGVYNSIASTGSEGYPGMKASARFRIPDVLFQAGKVGSEDERFQTIMKKITAASFNSPDPAVAFLEQKWSEEKKSWLDLEVGEFEKKKKEGEFEKDQTLSSRLGISGSKEDDYLAAIYKRLDEKEQQHSEMVRQTLLENKRREKEEDWAVLVKNASKEPLPDRLEWEREWDERKTDLESGITFDDLTYIFTNDAFKSVLFDLFLGNENSSSVRVIYDRWYALRMKELKKEIEEEKFVWEQEELLKDLEKGNLSGLSVEYMLSVMSRASSLTSWKEAAVLIGAGFGGI